MTRACRIRKDRFQKLYRSVIQRPNLKSGAPLILELEDYVFTQERTAKTKVFIYSIFSELQNLENAISHLLNTYYVYTGNY